MEERSYQCCIIGAGPAGLGAALELTRQGVTDIIIIDKNKVVGGLARTETYDGIRFDIGPHRFFTKNQEVNRIWHEALGEDFRPVARLTRIFYKNKYFHYPITPFDTLIKLGPLESLQVIFSFLRAQMGKKTEARTFEDWIVQRFGRKLYRTFFKTYTEKVWGIPCSKIGEEWAAQRIKGLDALEVIKNALGVGWSKKIKTLIEEFDYPLRGAGQMYESLCDKVLAAGARLMLESKVTGFNRLEDAIRSITLTQSNGEPMVITARHFFSSIPLTHFFNFLNPADAGLGKDVADTFHYRDHITVNVVVDKEEVFPDQWIYVHSSELQMARVANYNNFSRAMVGGKQKTALSVEYFVFKGEGLWSESDASLAELAARELSAMGLVTHGEIEKAWVVRETEAYPIYYAGIVTPSETVKSRINQFRNFTTMGRAGLHKYNNQDHAIYSGMLAARNYLKLRGSPYVLWDINTDAEYLENAQKMP